MENVFYNPENGNAEVWETKPTGYLTKAEFDSLHPTKYFAFIGSNEAESVVWNGAYTPSNPEMVEMVSAPKGDYYIAQADGTWLCDLEKYRAEKTAEIQGKSNALMAETKKTYTDGEISTFEQQYRGATDIQNDNELTTNAIFVIALLTGRLGRTPTADEKQAFAERIISNYTAAAVATAEIVGKQQRLELAIRAATTEAELDEIKWEE